LFCQVLSVDDVRSDASWCFAPIVVTNNAQRHVINAVQVVRFARATGQPVVRWFLPLTGRGANYMSHQADERTRKAFYEKHPELVQYFVKGIQTACSSHLLILLYRCASVYH
jgi:hypothetical protein